VYHHPISHLCPLPPSRCHPTWTHQRPSRWQNLLPNKFQTGEPVLQRTAGSLCHNVDDLGSPCIGSLCNVESEDDDNHETNAPSCYSTGMTSTWGSSRTCGSCHPCCIDRRNTSFLPPFPVGVWSPHCPPLDVSWDHQKTSLRSNKTRTRMDIGRPHLLHLSHAIDEGGDLKEAGPIQRCAQDC
jgi:hypothetical protein